MQLYNVFGPIHLHTITQWPCTLYTRYCILPNSPNSARVFVQRLSHILSERFEVPIVWASRDSFFSGQRSQSRLLIYLGFRSRLQKGGSDRFYSSSTDRSNRREHWQFTPLPVNLTSLLNEVVSQISGTSIGTKDADF